jgi:hypothetical protein
LEDDFIRNEIEALEKEIEGAKKLLASMEQKDANAPNDKVYKVLKSKMTDWVNKRNLLLEQLVVKPLRRK